MVKGFFGYLRIEEELPGSSSFILDYKILFQN